MTRSRIATVVIALTAVIAAGCAGQEGGGDPGGDPSHSPALELTLEQVYARIPLDGTERVPLTWELPEVDGSGEALPAARHYLALNYHEWSLPDPASVFHLYAYLLTPEQFNTISFQGTPEPTDTPATGPVWIKVLQVESLSDTDVRVHFCRDNGWWGPTSEPLPRTNRAVLSWVELVWDPADDAEPRWRVSDELLGPFRNEPPYEAYETACERWATHSPPA